jgi:anti-sigma-K factor RskA
MPEGRVMQLWARPPEGAPIALGLIPAGRDRLTVGPAGLRPAPGMVLEITLEPAGGSPTGPVLFSGRLGRPGGG